MVEAAAILLQSHPAYVHDKQLPRGCTVVIYMRSAYYSKPPIPAALTTALMLQHVVLVTEGAQ